MTRPAPAVSVSAMIAYTPPCTSPSGCLQASVTGTRARTSSSVEDTISRSISADILRELNDRSSRLGPTMPTMAPDQRAALELVLRQGRSYGELADLLGLPEETIRTRARGGVAALAPDLPEPARAGELADWPPGQEAVVPGGGLAQQAESPAARTRALLLSDPAAHRWTATVASALRLFPGGENLPPL